MTAKEVKLIDKQLKDALGADPTLEKAKGKGKEVIKSLWPAIKGMLQIVKNTFGLFKPAWRIGIEAFISVVDIWLGETTTTETGA